MRFDPGERYQTADEMLLDIERVLRTVYEPVGQSELKRWLAALGARDGVRSISKMQDRNAGPSGHGGTGELEGKDVELSDSSSTQVDAEEATAMAVVEPGGGEARRLAPRPRSEAPLPVPEDDESGLSDRHSMSEIALPVPDDEGPPGRTRRPRRGGGIVRLLLFGALLIGGAAVAGRYLGLRAEEQGRGDKKPAAMAEPAAPHGAAAMPAGEGSAAQEETPPAPKRPGDREREREPAAAREAPAKRARPAEHAERPAPGARVQRDMADLKKMMAPDPSQLAPAAPAAAPKSGAAAAASDPPPPPPAPQNP